MTSGIRIGTAGWSYDDWRGVVYPQSPGPDFDPLRLLAGWFDLVELNVSFYRIVPPQNARSWLRRIEDCESFRFTAKLHQGFTHRRDGDEELMREYLEGMVPLREAGRLGALLLQFPWSFERDGEAEAYLLSLLDRLDGWPRVVEVRHASWDDAELRARLHEAGVGLCSLDMPTTQRSVSLAPHVTAPVAYLRLHGRNTESWFDREAGRDARYDWLYSEEELDEIEARIRTMAEAATETFVVANNHFRGQAVATALALRHRFGGERPRVPDRLVEAYPDLRPHVEREGPPAQPELFS